ncbi:FAD-binding dehydrogenase, partial [Mycobacterium marinum]
AILMRFHVCSRQWLPNS